MLYLSLILAAGFTTQASAKDAIQQRDVRIRVDREANCFRDSENRTLLFRGINFVEKSSPWLPKVDNTTIKQLLQIGSNAVRLGVMMSGVFPNSSTPDQQYLQKIQDIVDNLWSHGIASIIDLHQDVLGHPICGEGMPGWMWNVSELHSLNFPEPISFTDTSKANPATGAFEPTPNCKPRGLLGFVGWSEFYMTDACGKAFDRMYKGVSVMGRTVLEYWKVVAARFRDRPGVLAYELLNEPWIGDHMRHPSLLLEGGAAERDAVGPFMERMHQAIRQVDPDTMILFAPAELNNRLMRPVGYERGFLPGEPMAFHTYCVTGTDGDGPTNWFTKGLCHFNDHFQLDNRRNDLKRLGTAGIVTEFGAVGDVPTGLAEVRFVADHFDGQFPLSWIYWSYSEHSCNVPQQTDYKKELARSYPRAVAGNTRMVKFDAGTGDFVLKFQPAARGKTEIYLSKELHYPNGWSVHFEPTDCCEFKNVTAGWSGIEVSVTKGAANPAQVVTVTVKKK